MPGQSQIILNWFIAEIIICKHWSSLTGITVVFDNGHCNDSLFIGNFTLYFS